MLQVREPVSELTLLSVTKMVMLVWAVKSVKKLPLPFEVLSSTLNSESFLFVVAIGGGRLGAPHTVPCKVQGKSGSVRFRIIPAPRGTGLVAARVPKKVLTFAGIKDCYTASTGQSKTLGNFVKATIDALVQTYSYLTPDLWTETEFTKNPYQEFTDFLKENSSKKKLVAQA